ncbi:uncharacterized protein J3R85_018444 [Psidium guajava]|nr:uncharacterized protein J3R85_018444 [Psidium guajava]
MSPYTRLGLQAFFTAVFTTTDLLQLLLPILQNYCHYHYSKQGKGKKTIGGKKKTEPSFSSCFVYRKI